MNPTDDDMDDQDPIISSRPAPYLPPTTQKQAIDALFSPQAIDASLFGAGNNGLPGLASGLTADPLALHHPQGLGAALAAHGITTLPDSDPRLVNITTNPAAPQFQTAQGTVIKMNHPAPRTTLPWGDGLDRMTKFADATGNPSIILNGGTEVGKDQMGHPYHSTNSLHGQNKAIDVKDDGSLDEPTVRKAALAAGYTYAIREIKSGGPHWHLQVGPDNIKGDPSLYQLKADTPIRTIDYTQAKNP